MVTIIGFKTAENGDGKTFFKLLIQAGLEVVQSRSSGRFYLTARTTSIPTTFDEATCKRLVGTSLKGAVVKVATDPYDYKVPETGEVISLNHRWIYDPADLMGQEDQLQPRNERALVS